MIDNKKILITGASGFVGSCLLREIINRFAKANTFIFLRKNSKTWRIKDLLDKTKVLEVDLLDKNRVKTALSKIKPDIIFHLAAYGAYPAQNSLEDAIKANILGMTNLLTSLEKIDFRLFVNTGSSSEYGYKSKPMKETDFLEPASFYAATKASATMIGYTFGVLNRLPIVTLRLFSVYGPYEEPGRFIPTAVISALEGRDINVVRGPKRDFIYVKDVVDAYLSCLELKDFDHRIFNICSGSQTSIEKAAKTIVKLTNSSSKINVGTYEKRPWDTNYWVGDNTLAKKILKWEPRYDFEKGLYESIKWFSKNTRFYERE
jgi:nucleoside-diphosphate-sugar epimerase